MRISIVIVVSCVLTLAFAIFYSERRVKALKETVMQRDECLRFLLLVAAHRAADRPLVEEIEAVVSEDVDEVAVQARRTAFEMDAKDAEAQEAA